jgi:adenine phosphoribosyltransferase
MIGSVCMTFETEIALPKVEDKMTIPCRFWDNHPKPGFKFPDMAIAMRDRALFPQIIKALASHIPAHTDAFAGIDIGGAVLAGALAFHTRHGFLEARKVSNMRPELVRVLRQHYVLGDGVCMARDGLRVGQRVVLVDDCIVSGSVAVACVNLLRREGVLIDTALFAFEIVDGGGRASLAALGVEMHALQAFNASGETV